MSYLSRNKASAAIGRESLVLKRRSVGGDDEVYGDAPVGFDRLAVTIDGFVAPLLCRVHDRGGQDGVPGEQTNILNASVFADGDLQHHPALHVLLQRQERIGRHDLLRRNLPGGFPRDAAHGRAGRTGWGTQVGLRGCCGGFSNHPARGIRWSAFPRRALEMHSQTGAASRLHQMPLALRVHHFDLERLRWLGCRQSAGSCRRAFCIVAVARRLCRAWPDDGFRRGAGIGHPKGPRNLLLELSEFGGELRAVGLKERDAGDRREPRKTGGDPRKNQRASALLDAGSLLRSDGLTLGLGQFDGLEQSRAQIRHQLTLSLRERGWRFRLPWLHGYGLFHYARGNPKKEPPLDLLPRGLR